MIAFDSSTPDLAVKQQVTDPFNLAVLIAQRAADKKAKDIQVLEISSVSSLADYFVICSAESKSQMKAISSDVEKDLRAHGIEANSIEKDTDARWYLLDYGDVILHIFDPKQREHYELEQFWSHAAAIPAQDWTIAS